MTKRRHKPTVMIGPKAAGLKSFLTKVPPSAESPKGWALYFCRGPGKCPKGPIAQKLGKSRCADCVRGHEGEQLSNLMTRIEQGNG